MAFTLRSPAIAPDGSIPSRHTCDGEDLSPPLSWSDPPEGTRSYVLIIDDPDAPDPAAPKMVWVHWVLYDIPADVTGFAEGSAPARARAGLNDWNRAGYGGPCPPIGTHRYFHKLYALDTLLGDLGTPTRQQVEQAMEGHVLGAAEVVATYRRAGQRS